MSAEDGPMDVARRVFAAFEGEDWPTLAALINPGEQQAYHERQLALLVGWAQKRPDRIVGTGVRTFTADLAFDPTVLQRFAETPIPAFRGAPTLGELAGLSSLDFMVESLSASHGGSGMPPSLGFGGLVSSHREILGALVESERLAHVLYRTTGDGAIGRHPWHVSVMSFAREAGGDWLLMPDDELTFQLGLTAMLFRPPDDGVPAP